MKYFFLIFSIVYAVQVSFVEKKTTNSLHGKYFKQPHNGQGSFKEIYDRPQREFSKFLIYLPYQGTSNQQIQLARAVMLAKELDRILIVPPMVASDHDTFITQKFNLDVLTADWETFYDFSDWPLEDRPSSHSSVNNYPKNLLCHTSPRFATVEKLGKTTANFLKAFDLNLNLQETLPYTPSFDEIAAKYKGNQESYLCFSNMQHMKTSKEEYELVASMWPANFIQTLARKYLEYNGVSEKYVGIHLRRGDFSYACNVGKKDRRKCQQHIEDVFARIPIGSRVLLATNEHDEKELQKFEDLNWQLIQFNNSFDNVVQVFGPSIFDSFLLSLADKFIGNPYSSFSRIVILRNRNIKKFIKARSK